MATAYFLSPVLSAVADDAMASGLFDRVNQHEAAKAPGTGLTADVWVDTVEAAPGASGLAASGAVVTFNVRIYAPLVAVSRDLTDPKLVDAVATLMGAYVAGFTLTGLIRNVDVGGEFGRGLTAPFGYITTGGIEFRVATISLPCVINDLWVEVP
jgi:hypothetical protein